MRNLFLSLFAVFVFIGVLGLVVKTSQGQKTIISSLLPHFTPSASSAPATLQLTNLKPIKVGNVNLLVQVASDETSRTKGLGGINTIPMNEGMLFVFVNQNIVPSFWMKDMMFPLDFIWIKGNKVAQIDANVANPTPNTPDKNLKIYTPSLPIDYVLEVNAKFSEKNMIKVGDSVNLNL